MAAKHRQGAGDRHRWFAAGDTAGAAVFVRAVAARRWRGLYLFELGLAVVALGCVLILKLPPSDRSKVFEKMDFVTFILMAPGMALLCGVLSLGRIEWWFTTPGSASARRCHCC